MQNDAAKRLRAFLANRKAGTLALAQQNTLVEKNLNLAEIIAYKFRNITERTSAWDEDDIKQTAKLLLAKAANTYNPVEDKDFESWASVVIRNGLRDVYRSVTRHDTTISLNNTVGDGENGEEEFVDRVEDESINVVIDANDSLRRELGRKVLDGLSEEDRNFIEPILGGRSFSKVAEQFGCTKQNIHVKFWQVINKAREVLEEMVPLEEGVKI